MSVRSWAATHLRSGLKKSSTPKSAQPPYIPQYHGSSHESRTRFSPCGRGCVSIHSAHRKHLFAKEET